MNSIIYSTARRHPVMSSSSSTSSKNPSRPPPAVARSSSSRPFVSSVMHPVTPRPRQHRAAAKKQRQHQPAPRGGAGHARADGRTQPPARSERAHRRRPNLRRERLGGEEVQGVPSPDGHRVERACARDVKTPGGGARDPSAGRSAGGPRDGEGETPKPPPPTPCTTSASPVSRRRRRGTRSRCYPASWPTPPRSSPRTRSSTAALSSSKTLAGTRPAERSIPEARASRRTSPTTTRTTRTRWTPPSTSEAARTGSAAARSRPTPDRPFVASEAPHRRAETPGPRPPRARIPVALARPGRVPPRDPPDHLRRFFAASAHREEPGRLRHPNDHAEKARERGRRRDEDEGSPTLCRDERPPRGRRVYGPHHPPRRQRHRVFTPRVTGRNSGSAANAAVLHPLTPTPARTRHVTRNQKVRAVPEASAKAAFMASAVASIRLLPTRSPAKPHATLPSSAPANTADVSTPFCDADSPNSRPGGGQDERDAEHLHGVSRVGEHEERREPDLKRAGSRELDRALRGEGLDHVRRAARVGALMASPPRARATPRSPASSECDSVTSELRGRHPSRALLVLPNPRARWPRRLAPRNSPRMTSVSCGWRSRRRRGRWRGGRFPSGASSCATGRWSRRGATAPTRNATCASAPRARPNPPPRSRHRRGVFPRPILTQNFPTSLIHRRARGTRSLRPSTSSWRATAATP